MNKFLLFIFGLGFSASALIANIEAEGVLLPYPSAKTAQPDQNWAEKVNLFGPEMVRCPRNYVDIRTYFPNSKINCCYASPRKLRTFTDRRGSFKYRRPNEREQKRCERCFANRQDYLSRESFLDYRMSQMSVKTKLAIFKSVNGKARLDLRANLGNQKETYTRNYSLTS
ncbi:hypothetical protein K9M41_04110 [Candidatus Gracilibacteria bacterium]|nr:hypothetical protein [Candidatus Gracilibacteria bacterium]